MCINLFSPLTIMDIIMNDRDLHSHTGRPSPGLPPLLHSWQAAQLNLGYEHKNVNIIKLLKILTWDFNRIWRTCRNIVLPKENQISLKWYHNGPWCMYMSSPYKSFNLPFRYLNLCTLYFNIYPYIRWTKISQSLQTNISPFSYTPNALNKVWIINLYVVCSIPYKNPCHRDLFLAAHHSPVVGFP